MCLFPNQLKALFCIGERPVSGCTCIFLWKILGPWQANKHCFLRSLALGSSVLGSGHGMIGCPTCNKLSGREYSTYFQDHLPSRLVKRPHYQFCQGSSFLCVKLSSKRVAHNTLQTIKRMRILVWSGLGDGFFWAQRDPSIVLGARLTNATSFSDINFDSSKHPFRVCVMASQNGWGAQFRMYCLSLLPSWHFNLELITSYISISYVAL
jgi:hypothetical protein